MNDMKKLKIAMMGIKGLPAKYGADLVVEQLVEYLLKDGYQLYIYGDDFGIKSSGNFRIIKIFTIKKKYLRPVMLSIFSAFHALLFGNYDLIHIHNVEFSFILPFLRIRYPVILTSHGMAYKREKWPTVAKKIMELIDIVAFKYSNVITSVSKNLTDYYVSKYERKCIYIPNGISPIEDINLNEAQKILSSINLKPFGYISFAAGRIMPSKGCHFLLEACRKLKENSLLGNLKILVIGDASHMKDYAERLKEILPEETIFYPLITDKKVLYGLLKLSKLFVFPSTYEAMSMMLLEAIMLQIPIICSDIPENLEIIENREIFFKTGDIENLYEKLIWALKNFDYLVSIIKKEKEIIVKEKNWENIKELYINSYKLAINDHLKI